MSINKQFEISFRPLRKTGQETNVETETVSARTAGQARRNFAERSPGMKITLVRRLTPITGPRRDDPAEGA